MSETPQNEINPLKHLDQLKRGEELTTPALVLRIQPFRESDLIAHILSPFLGKLSVIARHARGSRKRFPSSLDVFDRGVARLTLEKNRGLAVKEFTPSHSLKRVREELDKLTLASLLCEAFDRVLQEDDHEGAAESFEVLDLSLNAINEAADVKTELRAAFVGLANLVRQAGIADLTDLPPGKKALEAALGAIETFTDRPLVTKQALLPLIKKAAAASTSETEGPR
jgi:hypothetical protein